MNRTVTRTKQITFMLLATVAALASWAAQPGPAGANPALTTHQASAAAPVQAQESGTLGQMGQASTPLEKMLNEDGTLNVRSGFSGSLDPAGWQMMNEPGAPPRFTRADKAAGQAEIQNLRSNTQALGDENWDSRFDLGTNGTVYAIAVSGSTGDVYVGGIFTLAGGVAANYIARWNGSQWSALGTGTNGTVSAIAVSGSTGDVYVGGFFTLAGGVAANYIARWNGSQWSALGTGTNSYVNAIAVSGSNVYVGGYFTQAGGVSANHIARWTGTSWSALGTGTNSYVNAIAVSGSNVYVGGQFTLAGGVSTNRIARWNGSQWSALGTGTNSTVYAIAVSGSTGDVYVGGFFTLAGGVSIYRIARWNGTSWSALGTGTNSTVYAIAVSGSTGDVYVGGDFTLAGGVSTNRIARWNGSQWSALGTGTNSTVYAIAVSGSTGDVYVGGGFTQAGAKPSYYFGIWHDPLVPIASPTPTQAPPTATRTNTPVPIPTNTPVPVPPTATNTSAPIPTNTPVPVPTGQPTNTSVPLPTSTSTSIPPSNCAIQFVDVPQTDTFYTNIRCLACRNVLGGYADGTFRPGNNITRGQLSKVVANAAGYNEAVSGQTFSDVPPTDTFYLFIERMARRGIIGGYNDGTFRPGNPATRGQISKIVSNALGLAGAVSGQTFTDVPTNHPFYEFIERIARRGIIGGYSDGTFRPGNNATRGQVSKIVANAFFPGCQTP